MIKFLVIEQDLRVSGTSQGIISRSFLAKLRIAYPKSNIDVVYLKQAPSEDQLELLPVNNIESHILNIKTPFLVKWYNKLYWRLFHVSLNERYTHKVFGSYIKKINYNSYDHIFIRSGGVDHEMLLAAVDLPILKQAILVFHDPYPLFWYSGVNRALTKLELRRYEKMFKAVCQAKTCISSAYFMSRDLEFLYGTRKHFYTLPHQYDQSVFRLTDHPNCFEKKKQIMICYHGAIQFGRDICPLLNAYKELVTNNDWCKNNTEFVVRVKNTLDINYLTNKYAGEKNIRVLGPASFSESAYEQAQLADINIVLENGPIYCNILVGKAPFLASIGKPVLSLSPPRSELKSIINNEDYIVGYNNQEEIKWKLNNLIQERRVSKATVNPFGDYFSDNNFKKMLDAILCK